jgi:hypothetical protein
MQKQLVIIGIVAILVCVFISGCSQQRSGNNAPLDPIIQRAEPYLSKIETENITLRSYANNIIKNISPNDKEALVNAIYRYVVENYNYVNNSQQSEFIQSPQETIQVKGGDCEDLAILLDSLLGNIGIKTYLVLTDTHCYALASGINATKLWDYVEPSLIAQVEKDSGVNIRQWYNETFVLQGNYNTYYGGNGSSFNPHIDYMNISYDITSNQPFHFYVVPSRNDFNLLSDRQPFTHYPAFERPNALSIKGIIPRLNRTGGIVLANTNTQNATITVQLLFYFHPSFHQNITSYKIKGVNCVVLDATAGVYGYPGYDSGLVGEKIAIDPISKEYFNLQ